MTTDPSSRAHAIEAVVAAWRDLDLAWAALSADRAIVEESSSLRALVVERAIERAADPAADEIFDACALLGRRIAQARGSATFASVTVDNAAAAMNARGADWLAPARAAVAEGYAAEILDGARAEAQRAWEYPRCAVPLGGEAIAIAAGHPSDDPEAVADWASRVAKAAAMAGVRTAFVTGAAAGAVVEALGLVGVRVVGQGRVT